MRAAPPVDAALDAGRRERMLTVLLHLLAGGVLAAWLALQAELTAPSAWAGLLVLSAGALGMLGHALARRTWPASPGRLRWDGRQWHLAGHGADRPLHRVVVALDLGVWLLLQLHPADGDRPVWRVASAPAAQGAWHGLRLALAAHAGRTDAGGDTGAAP
jgi:hypothetical protein